MHHCCFFLTIFCICGCWSCSCWFWYSYTCITSLFSSCSSCSFLFLSSLVSTLFFSGASEAQIFLIVFCELILSDSQECPMCCYQSEQRFPAIYWFCSQPGFTGDYRQVKASFGCIPMRLKGIRYQTKENRLKHC